MAAGGLTREAGARWITIGLALGIGLALIAGRWLAGWGAVEVRGRMAEFGGWAPAQLAAVVGEPLRLRLVSDDVTHGFAVGRTDWPAIDLPPGTMVETTLTFDQPGTYTFYCTRWCGLSHWRMRGTIEVTGGAGSVASSEPPLFVQLGLDIDAPHPPPVVPVHKPSAARGAALSLSLPGEYTGLDYLRVTSPAAAWQALRGDPALRILDDQQIWDAVALLYSSGSAAAEAGRLYADNCAACHGERGAGDGVMAPALAQNDDHAQMEFGAHTLAPSDFTDPALLGASPAALHGKITRGGMGTGMPYWGPIFTDAQIWALVEHLWTFQFDP